MQPFLAFLLNIYGTQADVVLGYGLFDLYLNNPAFGAVGPSANRADKRNRLMELSITFLKTTAEQSK